MNIKLVFENEKTEGEKRKKTRKNRKDKERNKSKEKDKKEASKKEAIPDFNNETLLNSIKTNKYFYIALIVSIAFYCKTKKKSIFLSLISFILMTLFGYLAHIISHKVNMNQIYNKAENKNFFTTNKYTKKITKKICDFMDFHDAIHHDTEINKQPLNIFYEVANNFLIQGGLIYAVYIASRYIEPEMFLLWAFMYTTIHHINYPLIGSKEHRQHHENKFTNYGLDIWDVIFNTKPKPKEDELTTEIEDFNHIIFNLIIGVAILYFIF